MEIWRFSGLIHIKKNTNEAFSAAGTGFLDASYKHYTVTGLLQPALLYQS
jgi:hypothetical protein